MLWFCMNYLSSLNFNSIPYKLGGISFLHEVLILVKQIYTYELGSSVYSTELVLSRCCVFEVLTNYICMAFGFQIGLN
jgi:hypothetical protein